MDTELGIDQPSGHHISAKDDKDFLLLVKEIHERGDMFTFTPEQKYQKISNFSRNIFGELDFGQLNKWINTHKKQLIQDYFFNLSTQPITYYYSKLELQC